jgi:hypothetical protein
MIETVLEAKGFPEAYGFLDQPHIHNELLDITDRARRGEDRRTTESTRPLPAVMRGFRAARSISL